MICLMYEEIELIRPVVECLISLANFDGNLRLSKNEDMKDRILDGLMEFLLKNISLQYRMDTDKTEVCQSEDTSS